MAVLAVVDLELLGIVGDAVLVIVILDGGANRFLGEDGAEDLLRGQTVERLDDSLVGKLQPYTFPISSPSLRVTRTISALVAVPL